MQPRKVNTVQFPDPRPPSPTSPAFKPVRSSPKIRPQDLKKLGSYILGVFSIVLLLIWLFSGSSSERRIPSGTPGVVIVTTLDHSMTQSFRDTIMENRRDYASRHGYATFFPNTTDYHLISGVPRSWSTVPALRHAMTLWPYTPWLFYLSNTALIMDPHESLHDKLLEPRKLESLMIVDKPVVPPDSVIKTFPNLKGEKVDFILSQDKDGLAGGSLLIRTGEWAKFFLDAWFDPLYRSYNFQKAENHALEHLVQWHGTILAKLALIPQRVLNSYLSRSDAHANNAGKLPFAIV